jgi:prolipoprotein diacylglyceryltransferase
MITLSNALISALVLGMLLAGITAQDTLRDKTSEILRAHALAGGAALAGARLGFILQNTAYFQEHPGDMLRFTEVSGLSVHGALLGALLMALALPAAQRAAVAWSAVLAAAALATACIEHGCGAGREVFWTEGWLWALRVDWPDHLLQRNPRLPSQLFYAAGALLCASLLWKTPLGWRLPLALGGLSTTDFFVQFSRPANVFYVSGLRVEHWLDIAILCAALGLGFVTRKHIAKKMRRADDKPGG